MKRILYIIIPLLSLLFLANHAQAGIIIRPVLNTGLVGYWDFQEGAGNIVHDKSGQGNDGSWSGTGSHWVDGKIGKAGNFNGADDYIDTNTEMGIDGMTEISVCAWMYWAPASVGKDATIVTKWDDSDQGMMMWVDDIGNISGRTNTISWTIRADSSTRIEGSTNLVTPQNWDYYCGVFKGSSFMRLYKNGILDQEITSGIEASVQANTANVRIGRGSYTPDPRYFDGKIDEVRIYNRALSESEIGRLYKLSQPKMYSAPKNGLVGYWNFEEGSGTKVGDMSGNGNNGTLQAGMTQSDWVDGKFGKALEFDGGSNDYLDFSNPANLQLGNTGTVAAWLKYSTQNNSAAVISKNNWCIDVNGYNLAIGNGPETKGKIYGEIADGSNYNQLGSTHAYNDNQWHHVIFIWDGSSLHIYVDGVEDATPIAQTLTPVSNVYNLTIGDNAGCPGLYYSGQIDEVRIYNRDLDASEITALYKTGIQKINSSQNNQLTDGLVGFWSFNGTDMESGVAFDRSGNGNDGTVSGATKTIGKVGQALSFNGSSDWVEVTDNTALDMTSSFTVSAWVNANSLTRTDVPAWDSIVTKGNVGETSDVNHNYLLGYNGDSSFDPVDRWLFLLEDASGNNCDISGNAAASLGQWYHVVGVFDDIANIIRLYVNGVEQKNEACTLTVNTNNRPLRMGDDEHTNGLPWNGKIDEVRIYNRALEPSEIQRLYNLGR